MKVKFSFVPENILVQIEHGEFSVELTEAELEAYAEIEEKYFRIQNKLKEKARTSGGNKYFDEGR